MGSIRATASQLASSSSSSLLVREPAALPRVDDRRRLPGLAVQVEGAAERQRRGRRVGREARRAPQGRQRGLGLAVVDLGPPELDQDAGLGLGRRRLAQRATQVEGRAVELAVPARASGGAQELLDHPRLVVRRGPHQVGSDRRRVAPSGTAQGLCGSGMEPSALLPRDQRVDGGPEQRVDVLERVLAVEDLGRLERVDRGRERLLGQAGDRRDRRPLGSRSDYGDGSGNRERVGLQGPEGPEHAMADARGGVGADLGHGVGVESQPGLLGRCDQLAHEHRVSPGQPVADGGAPASARAHPPGDDLAHGRLGERREPFDPRVLEPERVRVTVRDLGRAVEARDQRAAEARDPRREVGGELQRLGVGILQVIDHEHERAVGGEVGGHPIEGVGERRRRAHSTRVTRSLAGQQRGGQGCAAGERAARPAAAGDLLLEQLQHDPERELPLGVRGSRPQHQGAVIGGLVGDRRQHRRLADSHRPGVEQQAAGARGRRGDYLAAGEQGLLALEQCPVELRIDPAHLAPRNALSSWLSPPTHQLRR